MKLVTASIFSSVLIYSQGVFASESFSNIGKVAPFETLFITSETTGVINDVRLEVGDSVYEGEPLVLINSTDHKHNLQVAQLELQQAELELSYQKDKFERVERLRKTNNASESELDDATFNMEKAKINLEQKKVSAQIAMTDYNRTSITAPKDSFVVERSADIGQFVQPSTVLFELVNSSKLKVETHASSSEIKKIKVGDKVSIKTTTKGKFSPIEGTISSVGISFSKEMHAYPVTIEFPFTKDVSISETVSVGFN